MRLGPRLLEALQEEGLAWREGSVYMRGGAAWREPCLVERACLGGAVCWGLPAWGRAWSSGDPAWGPCVESGRGPASAASCESWGGRGSSISGVLRGGAASAASSESWRAPNYCPVEGGSVCGVQGARP